VVPRSKSRRRRPVLLIQRTFCKGPLYPDTAALFSHNVSSCAERRVPDIAPNRPGF
jgi:hypothetical protein